MDNTATHLEQIQSKLPRFYKKYELKDSGEKSVMYALLNAFVKSMVDSYDMVARLDDALGIDTTHGEDLQARWGNLLGINKKDTESYDLYRSKLKLAIPSLVGGTRDTIIYAIATVIGIEKDKELQSDFIDVVDGWEYNGEAEIPDEFKEYGNFVCTIDMSVGESAIDVEQQMIDSINRVKASGTNFYVIYKAFKILRYYGMDRFRYDSFNETYYDYLGAE